VRRQWLLCCVALVLVGGSAVAVHARALDQAAQPVYYIGTTEKAMALTFDVSWGEAVLPRVLGVLEREHQRATFFLSGPWSKTHPDMVRAILASGNELASHGQQHTNLSGVGTAGIADNVGAADAILRGYTEQPLRFFRPPNGDFDSRVVDVSRGLGYETVIWSVDSRDWMNPGVGSIISRVTGQAFPGAILLFHASDTCKQTDLALPAVIEQLRAAGYHLVTLGELWSMGPAMRNDPRGSGRKPNMPAGGTPAQPASTPPAVCQAPGAA